MTDDHNSAATVGVFYDHAAEKAVLGAMLADREQIAEVEPILTASSFHNPAHPLLFGELLKLRQADRPTDPISLLAHLAQTGQIVKVPENGTYVHTLYASAINPASATHFARIVAECALLREFDAGLHRIRTAIRSGGGSSSDLVEQCREMVAALADSAAVDGVGYQRWGEVIGPALSTLEHRRNGAEEVSRPIPTGFPDLDRVLGGGLRRRELIVIAGRPGEGKSTLASDIVREVAFHQWLPVGIVSMEMPRQEIFNRLVCAEAGVNSDGLASGFVDPNDWHDINEVCKETTDAPLFVDDTRGQTFADIRLRAKRLKQRHNIQLLAVDYLGLIECRDNRPRHQQVDELARRFFGLADELDVAVVLLAQLNRNAAQRADKRPILTDLKESGGIESHANVVIFVHRAERYDKDKRRGEADFIVAKNRSGEEVDVPVAAQLHLNRFFSMALEG